MRPIVRTLLALTALLAPAAARALEPTKASQIVSLNGFTTSSPACPGTEPANGILLVDRIGNADGSAADFVIPNGLVIKPPANLCFQPGTGVNAAVLVHGFLAKDK